MSHAALIMTPSFGFDVVFELIFAVIAVIIAIYACRIFIISRQERSRLFAVGFFMVAAAYVIESVINFLIIFKLNENICTALKVNSIVAFNMFGHLAHAVLMTSGVIVLLYTTLSSHEGKVAWLLLITSLIAILANPMPINIFYLLISIFLVFISAFYVRNHIKRKKATTLLVAAGFILWALSNIHFIFTAHHEAFYIAGHFLELGAYLAFLANFFMVHKK